MAPVQRTLEEKTRDVFRACVLFRGLPADACDDLASKAKIKTFKERETIFVMGAPGKSLMALLAGKVRISVSSPDGKEITLTTLQSGEIFGEIAVLDGRERTAWPNWNGKTSFISSIATPGHGEALLTCSVIGFAVPINTWQSLLYYP